eukprot:scaffold105661_cov26-Attheya_sp.AAC.1
MVVLSGFLVVLPSWCGVLPRPPSPPRPDLPPLPVPPRPSRMTSCHFISSPPTPSSLTRPLVPVILGTGVRNSCVEL